MDALKRNRRSGHPQNAIAAALDGNKGEDLPPGWKKVASRSKAGAFYYAHPATGRTQVEKPGSGADVRRAIRERTSGSSAQGAAPGPAVGPAAGPVAGPEFPKRGASRAADSVVELDDDADPATAAKREAEKRLERKRKAEEDAKVEAARKLKAKADAEAADADREEAMQKARERRARAMQVQRDFSPDGEHKDDDEEGEKPEAVSMTVAPVAKAASAGQAVRKGMRAGVADSSSAAKKKRGAWKKEDSSDSEDQVVTREDIERWKEENDWRETDTDDAKSMASEGEKAIADSASGRIPVPVPDDVFEPCLNVLKDSLWVERHTLEETQQQWNLGRAVGQVDIPMQHQSVSRQHASVVRKEDECDGAMIFFITDLGSAHGTFLDGKKLPPNTATRLEAGCQLRFGASTRLYVFHEPP